MKNKRGMTHLEVIISFSIFFMFLMFLMTFLNPVKSPNISPVLLDIVEAGVEKEAEIAILELPFILQGAIQIGSFTITNPFEMGPEVTINHIFIKDEFGKDLKFGLTPDKENLTIERSLNSKFYSLYLSDTTHTLLSGSPPSPLIPTGGYNFSVPRIKKLYSYEKLINLRDKYNTEAGYEELKQNFSFPPTMDFGIIIQSQDINIEMKVAQPERVEVNAIEKQVDLLKEEAGTKTLRKVVLNIQVW